MKNSKGFSNTEVVLAFLIIAILSIIAIPKYLEKQQEEKIKIIKSHTTHFACLLNDKWLPTYVDPSKNADFNNDGAINDKDLTVKSDTLSEIPLLLEAIYELEKSPWNQNKPLLNINAEPGSGQISVVCNDSTGICVINAYDNNQKNENTVDSKVASVKTISSLQEL